MTIFVFFVFIVVGNIHVTKIGPFSDHDSCNRLKTIIERDVKLSMQTDFAYGMVMDKWNIGNGAIYRIADYSVFCDSQLMILD